nr:40s ribosomal protein s15 [Quercus suber]
MADDEYNAEEAAELKKKRAFRKFSYRGIDLDELLDLSSEQLRDVVHARARRRFNRGLKRKPMGLIKKLRKAKQEAKPNEKPDTVKTHLRDMIIVPEMIGSVIGVYSGKEFNTVEIKPEMVGHYLAEFSISYKPVKHEREHSRGTHQLQPQRNIRFFASITCLTFHFLVELKDFDGPSSRAFHSLSDCVETTEEIALVEPKIIHKMYALNIHEYENPIHALGHQDHWLDSPAGSLLYAGFFRLRWSQSQDHREDASIRKPVASAQQHWRLVRLMTRASPWGFCKVETQSGRLLACSTRGAEGDTRSRSVANPYVDCPAQQDARRYADWYKGHVNGGNVAFTTLARIAERFCLTSWIGVEATFCSNIVSEQLSLVQPAIEPVAPPRVHIQTSLFLLHSFANLPAPLPPLAPRITFRITHQRYRLKT